MHIKLQRSLVFDDHGWYTILYIALSTYVTIPPPPKYLKIPAYFVNVIFITKLNLDLGLPIATSN